MSLRNQSFRRLLLCLAAIIPISLLLFIFVSPILGYIAGIAGAALAAAAVQSSLYSSIRSITQQVDALMSDGTFDKAPILKEGDLMALYARLILLNNRLKSTAEQKQKDKQLMRRFVEDVAHQLKTPLASLRLKLEAQDMDDNDPWIASCIVPIDRMTFLIQSLLTIARLEAGALQMTFADESIKKTIQSAADALSEKLTIKEQKVIITGDAALRFRHDAKWLMEALENLLKNASTHTPEGSSIEAVFGITGEEARPLLYIQVMDRGKGIPSEDLPKIFDRFYQGSEQCKTEGTGIGLALCKAIVTAHHGDIRAMNREGGGTTFLIMLPHITGSMKLNAYSQKLIDL